MAGKASIEILYGKCRWTKLFTPSQYGKWSLELNLDNESLAKVLELKRQGIRNILKQDDDGYWITVSRSCELNLKGKIAPNTPPVVLTNEDQPWPSDRGIGNGSDVAVKIRVKKYTVPVTLKEGIAIRVEAVKVLNLVPFDVMADFPEDKRKQVAGLEDAEAKPW